MAPRTRPRSLPKLDEPLAIYLDDPGTIPGIGPERGKKRENGISRFKSPHGSVRYVAYKDGKPIGALQVVTLDGEAAKIANVYTTPGHRREGVAGALLATARRDFKTVEHAEEIHLSPSGKAWRDKLGGAKILEILELPEFELLKRQPDPPHVARVVAQRGIQNEHGAIITYRVHESRKGTEWWISASLDGQRGKGRVYAGHRMSNTLHTAKRDKAEQWIAAVNSGRIRVAS